MNGGGNAFLPQRSFLTNLTTQQKLLWFLICHLLPRKYLSFSRERHSLSDITTCFCLNFVTDGERKICQTRKCSAPIFSRQPIAVSDISVYICLIDIRDGSCKPVYGGVDPLQALSSAKTGRRSCFFMNQLSHMSKLTSEIVFSSFQSIFRR